MTNNELKEALLRRVPVKAGGQSYTRVRAIIYTLPERSDELIVSGECYLEGTNSVTVHRAEDIYLLN